MHCNQCGNDWEPRKQKPVACPKCKRYDWNGPCKRKDERDEKKFVVPEEIKDLIPEVGKQIGAVFYGITAGEVERSKEIAAEAYRRGKERGSVL